MKAVLADLVSRSGVEAAFVCDDEGSMLAAAINDRRYQDALPVLSGMLTRMDTTLKSFKHGPVAEVEWVYAGGRVLVRGLDQALLCLICTRSINLQLLTMQLEQVSVQISSLLGSQDRPPSRQDIEALKAELIAMAEDFLGEHAGKVVAILGSSGDTLESIQEACDQSEKVTRLFIDRKIAGDMGSQLRARLDAYR